MPNATTYNATPAARSGNGIYGAVPGLTGLPDPYEDLAGVFPDLDAANAKLSGNILNQLNGVLSPATMAAIQDAGAKFGVSSGMPGAGLAGYKSLRDLGLSTEAVQQQGLTNYNATIPTIKATQTVNPETQIALSQSNAALAAAPDPTLAGQHSEALYKEYLGKMGGGGTGGGSILSPAGFGLPSASGGTGTMGNTTGVTIGRGGASPPVSGPTPSKTGTVGVTVPQKTTGTTSNTGSSAGASDNWYNDWYGEWDPSSPLYGGDADMGYAGSGTTGTGGGAATNWYDDWYGAYDPSSSLYAGDADTGYSYDPVWGDWEMFDSSW